MRERRYTEHRQEPTTANSGGTRNLRPWTPGQSGNPSGRPKSFANVIREQTEDGRELVDLMLRVLRGEESGVRLADRIAAASWLSDRAWGKPIQATEISGPEGGPQEHRYAGPDFAGWTLEELDDLEDRLRGILASQEEPDAPDPTPR